MTQPNFDNYLKETIHSCKCIQPESELYNDEKYSLFKEKVALSIKQDRVANRKVLFFSVVTIFVISLLHASVIYIREDISFAEIPSFLQSLTSNIMDTEDPTLFYMDNYIASLE